MVSLALQAASGLCITLGLLGAFIVARKLPGALRSMPRYWADAIVAIAVIRALDGGLVSIVYPEHALPAWLVQVMSGHSLGLLLGAFIVLVRALVQNCRDALTEAPAPRRSPRRAL